MGSLCVFKTEKNVRQACRDVYLSCIIKSWSSRFCVIAIVLLINTDAPNIEDFYVQILMIPF